MQQKNIFSILTLFVMAIFFAQAPLPQGFSYAKDKIPDLEIDLRYAKKIIL